MTKISNSSLVSIVTKLLVLLFIAKTISLSIWYYVGDDGVELTSPKNYQPEYQRVDFRYMIEKEKKVKKQKEAKKVVSGPSITSMILKGLYGKDENGFAIVALKSSPKKTSIVSIGEVFSGYTLKAIRISSVVFQKDGKDFILELKNPKIDTKSVKKVTRKSDFIDVEDGEPRGVLRDDINYFAQNPKEIWRNISIREEKKNGKITGFKIHKINKNSVFAQLGLQRGDLIIKANNITLTSYRNAIDLYNKIDKIDTMQIVIMRNNEEKELVYDIN